ncbi:MAG: hypothetical protein ACK56R_16605, partial [Pirellulaceae bacterium]
RLGDCNENALLRLMKGFIKQQGLLCRRQNFRGLVRSESKKTTHFVTNAGDGTTPSHPRDF